MASRIPPAAPRAPLFRRLVRDSGAVERDGHVWSDSGADTIRIPESLHYPQAMMHLEDMAVLLDTPRVRPTPGKDVPYEDADPAIDQYSFEFLGPAGSAAETGIVVSRQA